MSLRWSCPFVARLNAPQNLLSQFGTKDGEDEQNSQDMAISTRLHVHSNTFLYFCVQICSAQHHGLPPTAFLNCSSIHCFCSISHFASYKLRLVAVFAPFVSPFSGFLTHNSFVCWLYLSLLF